MRYCPVVIANAVLLIRLTCRAVWLLYLYALLSVWYMCRAVRLLALAHRVATPVTRMFVCIYACRYVCVPLNIIKAEAPIVGDIAISSNSSFIEKDCKYLDQGKGK